MGNDAKLKALPALPASSTITDLRGNSPPTGGPVRHRARRARRSPALPAGRSAHRRHSERTVRPYGIVAHSGRWYVTRADSASGEVRTFRLDRIENAAVLPGSFEVPVGFDPAARVLSGLAETPYLHEVSLRVRGTVEQVRARLPAGIANPGRIRRPERGPGLKPRPARARSPR
jgi:hypothetical protein